MARGRAPRRTRARGRVAAGTWPVARLSRRPTKNRQRSSLQRHLVAGVEPPRLGLRLRRRKLDAPARAESPRRQRERDRLVISIEEDDERVVDDRLSVGLAGAELRTVQKDA